MRRFDNVPGGKGQAPPGKSWDGLFLVDAGRILGATDSLVPRCCIEAIGLKPEGRRVYEMADGREVAMDFARAYIEFMGDLTAIRVIVGGDTEPLLGVTALEREAHWPAAPAWRQSP